MSIYRNPIYRERRVKLNIASATYINNMLSSNPSFDIETYLELVEVSTFEVQSNSGVSVSMGVKRGIIQPWYFGPYNISIVGKSYIGAYTDNRINYNKDDNVSKLMEYSQLIKDSFLNGDRSIAGAPNGIKVILSCIDPNVKGLFFGISAVYEGFVDDIKYTEDENNPYILTYSIKFIGELYQALNVDKGKNAATKNLSVLPNMDASKLPSSQDAPLPELQPVTFDQPTVTWDNQPTPKPESHGSLFYKNSGDADNSESSALYTKKYP